jgi:4-amino-4-deoxy-L-arabinose transferase-like glycosyltransferase
MIRNRQIWPEAIILAGLFLVICALIVLSLVPPISKDALTHHLAVPELYLTHGGFYEIPAMPFSYYPMNLDLLYLIPLYFGNDIAPKLIHFTFALLTAWLLFGYLRHRVNNLYALLGVVFFLSIPIIVKLSITVYVDLGLIFFSMAALLLLLKWLETRFQLRFLILSAIFCGLAMGAKYNGLITFFLVTLFVPFVYSRFGEKKSHGLTRTVGFTCVFVFTALLIFSPWMLRDYFWTGNPIYPLYDNWFNSQGHTARKSIGLFAYRALVYQEKWWEILLLPFRMFFQGQDGNPGLFDGKLNPFLLILPLFAFFRLKDDSQKIKTEKSVFLVFAGLYFAFAFFSSGLRIRYISPIIPPLVILAVFGIQRLFDSFAGARSLPVKYGGKLSLVFLVLFGLGLNAIYIREQFAYVKPLSYISGNVTRDEYIEKYRAEYPAMKFINDHLPSSARILFLFIGNRGYYCNKPYVFDMENNRSKLATLFRASHGLQDFKSGLKKEGITHFLINMDIFNRWALKSFDHSHKDLLRLFFKRDLRRIYSKNGYGVFALMQ